MMIKINNILDVVYCVEGLKVVVFDLDDTLYGEKEYIHSGYKKVAALIPSVEDAEKKLWDAFEEKKPAIDTVLLNENLSSNSLKRNCLETYRNQKPDIHLYNGVTEVFCTLRQKGLKIGILTDGRPEGQWAKIETLGLKKMVDQIIITDELGGINFRKPSKEAFVRIKERFKVNYCEIAYVGDNIAKDFIAPQELGMRSLWFINKDGLYYNK